ncbi:FAD-binding protein [Paraburkholderia aspalathi]|uniref:FAD-binding protein n=1 Tax=Paraburkholderia aspalathi TaxID=1324617 RepID=UPI0038BA0EF4
MNTITSTLYGYDPVNGRWLTTPTAGSVPVPGLDGHLSLDLPSRLAVSVDWGKTVHYLPSAVLQPGSVTDIVKMVRFCRSLGIKIGARGQAHAMYGQSQVNGGLLITMTSLSRIHSIESDRASVDAGLTWKNLLTATMAQGLTPPVLTDLPLSVGGTLSVGGVDGTAYRQGLQVDHILELDVVTGEGDLITCSMSHHRDLFEAALGGLGQCAIIVRASIKLIKAPARARAFEMAYADLESLLADFRILLADERFGNTVGIVPALPAGGFAYCLRGVSFYDETPPDDSILLSGLNFVPGSVKIKDGTYFDFCDRATAVDLEKKASGRWELPHPWFIMFIPDCHAKAYMSGILGTLTLSDIPDFPCFIYGFRKNRLTRPMPCTPNAEVFFLFNLLRTTDPERVSQAVVENRQFYDDGCTIGGRLYPISAVPLSKTDWQRHFEPHHLQFADAKARYDPDGILTPGPGIFNEPSDCQGM